MSADKRTQRLAEIKATSATTQSRTTLVADRWWLVQQVDALMAEVGALRQALQHIDEIVNLPANAVVDRVGRIAAIVRAAAGSERNETPK